MFKWSSYGRVKYKDDVFEQDIIVMPDERVEMRKPVGDSNSLGLSETERILAAAPETEIVVIGTGEHDSLQVASESRALMENRGLRLFVFPTPQALSKYNEVYFTKKTLALIHVTG